MGLISAILALLKAVPSLERLFLKIADGVKEANAANRYEDKLDSIDAAIADARGGMLHTSKNEWSADPDRSPPVPDGSTISATVDASSTEEGSGT
jgi:hypothetical protein